MTLSTPIIIDGSTGEGGGQILRTALTLSMCTGQPFQIKNIRAGREKPGLLRQHLTAVSAAAEICAAQVSGGVIGSADLAFKPGKVKSGQYAFRIGTAGSTGLVLQTVLPALALAEGESTVMLEGGTHNLYAPPFDFLDKAYLPLFQRMGGRAVLRMDQPGFYPAGGGRIWATIQPTEKFLPLQLNERGEIKRRTARALVAGLSPEIAKRELAKVTTMLGWSGEQLRIEQLPDTRGPGNVLLLEIESEHATEVFTGFGKYNLPAETVAQHAIDEARQYLARSVPVGKRLADQLLVPMALAGGGTFTTLSPSTHLKTNAAVIEKFLPVQFKLTLGGNEIWQIKI